MNKSKETTSAESVKNPSECLRVPGLASVMEELRAKYPALSEASVRRILGLPVLQEDVKQDDISSHLESEVNR
jgi:hypothetical protein